MARAITDCNVLNRKPRKDKPGQTEILMEYQNMSELPNLTSMTSLSEVMVMSA